MGASRSPLARLLHIRDEIVNLRSALSGTDYASFASTY